MTESVLTDVRVVVPEIMVEFQETGSCVLSAELSELVESVSILVSSSVEEEASMVDEWSWLECLFVVVLEVDVVSES
jgi:hypothetical protein